jgi:hypothetical protein
MDAINRAAARGASLAVALALARLIIGCGDELSPLRPLAGTCERPESLLLGEGGAVSTLGRLPEDDALASAAGCADAGAASAFFAITLTRPRQVVLSVESDAPVRVGFVDGCEVATPDCGRAARAVRSAGEHVIGVSGPPGAEIALGIATTSPDAEPTTSDPDLGTCEAPTPVTLATDGTATIDIDWSGPQNRGELTCSSMNEVQVLSLELAQARALRVRARGLVSVELREEDCTGRDPTRSSCGRLGPGVDLTRRRIGPGTVLLLAGRRGDDDRVTLELETAESPAPPDNVDCASAAAIEPDRNVAVDFGSVVPEITPQCREGYGLYYTFELPEGRLIRFVEQDLDLVFGIYDEQCQPLPGRSCVDRNLCTRDDTGDLEPGRYLLRVDPWRFQSSAISPAAGTFRLESVEIPEPPPGDVCAEAPLWALAEGFNEQTVTLRGATEDPDGGRPRVWRRVRVPFRADLDLRGPDLVSEGADCADLQTVRTPRELYAVPAGSFLFAVESYADICEVDVDPERIEITAVPTANPPANDDCAGAQALSLAGDQFARLEGELDGAYDDFSTVRCPGSDGTVVRGPDRVYAFDVVQPSRLRLTPLNAGWTSFLGSVHASADCASVDAVACFGNRGLAEGVELRTPGTYYLRLDQPGDRTIDIAPSEFGFILELTPL